MYHISTRIVHTVDLSFTFRDTFDVTVRDQEPMNTRSLILKALSVKPERTIKDLSARIDRGYTSTRAALSQLVAEGEVFQGYTVPRSQVFAYVLISKPKGGFSISDIQSVLNDFPLVVGNYDLITSERYSFIARIIVHVSSIEFKNFIDAVRMLAADTDTFSTVGVEA